MADDLAEPLDETREIAPSSEVSAGCLVNTLSSQHDQLPEDRHVQHFAEQSVSGKIHVEK